MASPVAEHRLQMRRLSGHGSRAQPLHGMWDHPGPGHEPVSPASAGRLSTTAPPGKPNLTSFDGAQKNNRSDMMSALGLGEEEGIESPWDSESISESLPEKYVDHLSGAAGQRGKNILNGQVEDVPYIPSCMSGSRNFKMTKLEDPRNVGIPVAHMDSPEKYPHLKPAVGVKDSVPNKAVGMKDLQTSRSDLSAELDLEITSEEAQERLDGSENNHSQDKVILKTCTLTEKTSENQIKPIDLLLLHLQKMPQEPEMNKECDREDISVCSGLPCVQKHEEMWIKRGKLGWKNNFKRITNKLKWKFGGTFGKYKITVCPEEEPLHDNPKEGANIKEIPSNLKNNIPDCEAKVAFGVSVSLAFQAFPEQKDPSLENVFPSYLTSGSWGHACPSSSQLYLNEIKLDYKSDKPDTEHVFNKNEESFYNDTENKKVRDPVVTFEMQEDQELDMQMLQNMNQNTTNWKLDIGCIPQSSDPKRLFDLWLARSNEMKHMIQIKSRDISAVTNTYKKTKPIQDWFQKPLLADNCSANNSKSMQPELENGSSSPLNSNRRSKVYLNEELQQDMQRLKNEIGMLQVEFLAFRKEKIQLQKEVEEAKKQHKSSEMEVSENIYDADDSGLIQQRKSRKTNNQQFPTMENEDSDSSGPGVHMKEVKKNENEKWTSKECVITPMFEKADSLSGGLLHMKDDSSSSGVDQDDGRATKETSNEKNKVKEQINSMDDLDDLTQSSETALEDCQMLYSNYKNSMLLIEQLGMECKDSVSLLKIQDAVLSYERLIELKKDHCELLTGKNNKMESKVTGLPKELSETKEMKSQLEHQRVEWEQELCSLRFTLKQEKKKRRNADRLYEKIREQLRRKEEQYSKEVEMKQQLELTLRALDMELRTVRNNLNQVSDSPEKEKDLLHKNHMLQDEVAMLRLEIDTIKCQNQEKEKKYVEDIEIVKEKNDDLQKTIKLNEETLTKTIFQYTGQLNVLTAENTMLNSKLENEKQSKERLEAEVESYRSRLSAAIHDHHQSQTSKRDLELAFQRPRDECLCLQDKMNFDVSNLKDNNEMLSQQLSKAESKFSSLKTKLHHTRDALREKTLVLECVQRDLSQAQCQKKELEHMYLSEQGKVNKYIGKQESLEERLSQLQSENILLRQQLDDAQNKADSREKTVINIQDQFQEIVKKLQAESEKQGLMLEERNKELINECNHLKERMYQYENEKTEREALVRQLQQELADTLIKQSMSEASLEATSRYRTNLEDEAQDLKKKLHQVTSQLQEAQDRCTEAMRCAEKTQDHIQKLEIENAKLKPTVKKQADKIEELQKNLLSTSSDEKEQLKKYIELKQSLEYSLDRVMKKNTELEKEIAGHFYRLKKLLKMARRKLNEYENGELSFHGDLKTSQSEMDIQINMLKHKTQAASQENLEQLRENHNASIRSPMELRIKDLESELSKMKTFQEDSTKAELEKYKQLYLEELKVRKSLANKLKKTNKKLAKVSTKLLVEKEQNRSLLSTLTTRPVLKPPCVGNINNRLVLTRYLTPGENLGISTSSWRPSHASMEIYWTKMWQEMEKI
ncbi:ankyrin repeat domain-containing protein 26-like isoform X4 [Mesoplodon densirostris]|uniref:ankyrin repeat domain-containing protein 26-like isoform X4 n=1 Tax=Mesoplodon densirostris TaxID=48708 RepID=UPI0028DBC8FD|nr:ankyrin repeat domain-containing protein 26-like isoform X4 [Mesoplodon densirostris]